MVVVLCNTAVTEVDQLARNGLYVNELAEHVPRDGDALTKTVANLGAKLSEFC